MPFIFFLDLKSSISSAPDSSKLQQEVVVLQSALDKTNVQLATQEKELKYANDQYTSYKAAAEEANAKV